MLAGIAAAQRVGFEQIRLNAVAIAGITEDEIVPLARVRPRARTWSCGSSSSCRSTPSSTGQTTRCSPATRFARMLEEAFGPLVPADRHDPSQPAIDFRFADGRGAIGFINPVTQPFCGDCNRLRLTAEGQVRNCLFSTVEWDARARAARRRHRRRAARAGPRLRRRQGGRPRHRQRRLPSARAGDVPDRRVRISAPAHAIYLDNAATSWPKPEAVYAAVDRYQREVGAAARAQRLSPRRSKRNADRRPLRGAACADADRASAIRERIVFTLQRHRRAEPGDPRRCCGPAIMS